MTATPPATLATADGAAVTSLRSIRVLVSGSALRWFGFSFYLYFILLALRSDFGLAYADAGLDIAVVALVTVPLSQIGGGFSDWFGRRRMIVITLAGEAVGLGILAWGFTIGSLVVVFGGLLLARSFGTIGSPSTSAYVADSTEIGTRAKGLSWVRVANNLGAFGGAALAGVLLTFIAYGQLTAVAAGMVGAAAVVNAVWLMPSSWDRSIVRRGTETSPSAEDGGPSLFRRMGQRMGSSFRPIWHDRTLLLLFLASTLILLMLFQIYFAFSTFGLIYLGIPFGILGAALSLNALIPVVGQVPVTAALAGRFHTRVGIWGAVVYALSFLAIGLDAEVRVEVVLVFIVVIVISTIGENMVFLPLFTLPVNIAPKGSRGTYSGAITTASSVGQIFAPILAGVALTFAAHPLVTWGILAMPALPAIMILWYLDSRIPREHNRI
ncbi:MAG: MFS transporter [Thermoplasmata archaeon]